MARPSVSKTNWQRIRKLFNDIHLWLGLTSGLVVLVICFSGTIYVFNTEITENSAPHLYKVAPMPGSARIPIDSLIEKVKTESGGNIISISIPADLNRTYQFNLKKQGDDSRGGIAYMVNPYTGKITGTSKDKNGTKEFMSTMFSLHRWLLLDKMEKPIIKDLPNKELGSMITGSAAILFTLGCITGIIIWFPQRLKNWKQGLKVKWTAGWKRTNHDMHSSLAFYAVFFLLLMDLPDPSGRLNGTATDYKSHWGPISPRKPLKKNH